MGHWNMGGIQKPLNVAVWCATPPFHQYLSPSGNKVGMACMGMPTKDSRKHCVTMQVLRIKCNPNAEPSAQCTLQNIIGQRQLYTNWAHQ
eukprot:6250453-Pyramimonas_sp.AAC.1